MGLSGMTNYTRDHPWFDQSQSSQMTSWVKPQSQSSQMMISPLTERELGYRQMPSPIQKPRTGFQGLWTFLVFLDRLKSLEGVTFFSFFLFSFFYIFFIFFITTFITTLLHHNTLIYTFYKLYYAYCHIRIKCQRFQIQHNVILIRNKILCQCLQIQHNNIL